MAFVVRTKRDRFEVRESHSTAAGPRSRTLASFTEMTEEVIEKARARSEKTLDAGALREAAVRAGAPIVGSAVDEAARETLRRVARGEPLDPMLGRLLQDALAPATRESPAAPSSGISDAARAAAQWVGASPASRGEALRDLLLLADALPVHIRPDELDFPRLDSD